MIICVIVITLQQLIKSFNLPKRENGSALCLRGAFYTITYLLELDLKRNGFIDKQARIARLREILNGVLDTFVIPELDWNILYEGVNNIAFTDLEDSYQYEVACRIASNYLITDNLNDYKNSDQTIISILSPVEFLSRVRGMTY